MHSPGSGGVYPDIAAFVFAILVIFSVNARAQGGPPLLTDDPDTPGPRHWEINLAGIVERSQAQTDMQEPLADINYGVGRRIQLKFEVPWLDSRTLGSLDQHEWGDALFGVKWRFLGQEGERLAWSVYPQYQINGQRSLLLPTEITVGPGPIEVNGEIGIRLVHGGDNGWIYGLSTEATLKHGTELVAEVHSDQQGSAPAEIIIQVGARPKVTKQLVGLFAVGRAVHGVPADRTRLRLFVGLQFNLPGQYDFSRMADR